MALDKKQEILLYIYTEYQKDLPNMKDNISSKRLGIQNDIFKVAIEKLTNEGLIIGAGIVPDGNSHIPAAVFTDGIKMTRIGIEYVEEKLTIKGTMTGEEKLGELIKKAASWGLEQLKDIAVKTLTEMSKQ